MRISQREEAYIRFLRDMIRRTGHGAWSYREGRNRHLYVVEFSRSVLAGHRLRTKRDRIEYIQGYFDAEGGLPSHPDRESYLYFAQKNYRDLEALRGMIVSLGIECGRIHNPSVRADPEYWRFYVCRKSHRAFAVTIGSWHPRKSELLWKVALARQGAGVRRRHV